MTDLPPASPPSGPELTPASDLSTSRVLRRYWWADHAWLRAILSNFHAVDADLYRSAHPGPRVLRKAKAHGVRSVLSLRGAADNTPNILERAAAAELGLDLRFVRMQTAQLATADTLQTLIDLMREMPKPMLVHCKSGADRTGLAVVLYGHVIKGEPLADARRALSWTYAHWRRGKAGIVHVMLDAYAADHATTGIGFEAWLATRYDPTALTARYSG